jgi:hypothetical protein
MKNNAWIKVDLAGFGLLNRSRPRVAILHDLLANAFDENATRVDVTLKPIAGQRGRALLVVKDDCPDGFADLRDAYTLYRPSGKKENPTQRGRFNEGEKFVLSLCDSATISSTTGTIEFKQGGQRRRLRKTTDIGSEFQGVLRVTQQDVTRMLSDIRRTIVPTGFTVTVNGQALKNHPAVRSLDASLPTVIADSEGVLRRTHRKTGITLHDPGAEASFVYEMGIPVCEIDTPWSINVGQKIPLNRDRDNITASYRATLLAAVLDAAVDLLTKQQASAGWVKDALPAAGRRAVTAATSKMFGQGWVIVSPSDPEANKNAMAHGKTVVTGGTLSREAWAAVREGGAAKPSSVDYSMKPPAGDREAVQATGELADALKAYATEVATYLLDRAVNVEVWDEPKDDFVGRYNGSIILNLGRLLKSGEELGLSVDSILIHECAHEFAHDHYTAKFWEACTRLGAKLRGLSTRWGVSLHDEEKRA